jgi:hypothetical protein
MILRLLLSFAMLMPAAPAELDCGQCLDGSADECRAMLDACCNAGDRVEEYCVLICDQPVAEDDTSSCCSTVATPSCCEVEVVKEATCCVSVCEDMPAGHDSREGIDEFQLNSTLTTSAFSCIWCCCCPKCPVRTPEPPQARVTQRASTEKEKADCVVLARRVEPPAIAPQPAPRTNPILLSSADSRQSLLCVWRE